MVEFQRAERPEGYRPALVAVESEVPTQDGNPRKIEIKLEQDGAPVAIAFFDIDGTLADLQPMHTEAIYKIFRKQADALGFTKEQLARIYFGGFKLGNSFREFDRMHGILVEGHQEWVEPEVYIKERLEPHQNEIDQPGNAAHERAAKYLAQYSPTAARVVETMFEKDPTIFETTKIKPIFHLAHLYKKLGIPMVGMTANGREFTHAVAKCLGMADSFIDIATDEDMAGGGKELAMAHLMAKLEQKGLKIPPKRLVVVGDSLRGDIGSGRKVQYQGEAVGVRGVLVLEDEKAFNEIEDQIAANTDLQGIISAIHTEGLIVDKVPVDASGKPKFGRPESRTRFLNRLLGAK